MIYIQEEHGRPHCSRSWSNILIRYLIRKYSSEIITNNDNRSQMIKCTSLWKRNTNKEKEQCMKHRWNEVVEYHYIQMYIQYKQRAQIQSEKKQKQKMHNIVEYLENGNKQNVDNSPPLQLHCYITIQNHLPL